MCALLQHHLLVPVQHYQDDHHCGTFLQCCTSLYAHQALLWSPWSKVGHSWWRHFRYPAKFTVLTVSPRENLVLPLRVDSICCELKQILSSKKLSKGHASEIFGKLSFSAEQLFGRFGRMYLVPFKLRQYGKNGCSHLTEEIERAIVFWLSVLPCGPFIAVLPHSGTPFVITRSDGEGTGSVATALVRAPTRWFQIDLTPGYTSSTTMVLWPALSLVAQRTAL